MIAEIKRKLENALVLMGEIGGNDYNLAFFQGKTLEQVYQLVPNVVQTIKYAVQVNQTFYKILITFEFYSTKSLNHKFKLMIETL